MKNQILSFSLLYFLLSGFSAFAGEPTVNFTSFNYIDPTLNTRTAEICGNIVGAFSVHDRVVLEVDPGKNAATYAVLPGPDGRFCQVVVSYAGKVNGSVWGGASSQSPAVAFSAARMIQ